jgi:hypothetical protein
MIRRLFAIFAVAGFGFLGGIDASITNCGSTSRFELTTLALHPDPPVAGKQVDMTVQFINPGSDVIDGTATTSVTLNFIPFQPAVKPLCEDTVCPILTGANDRSTSSIWPETVSGSVTSRIVWTATDGSELLCISIKTKVAASDDKGLRQTHNQTHAEWVSAALQLNAPVEASAFDTPLACFTCNGTWNATAR